MPIGDVSFPSSSQTVSKYLVGISVIVCLLILSIFWGFHWRSEDLFRRQLINNGRSFFEGIVMTRFWIASHQGVYVKKSPVEDVNPYLKGIAGLKTEIKDEDGEIYILKNPALVTREISLIADQKGLFKFHITSPNPLNPANAPDDFERRAIEDFQRGAKEAFIFEENGKNVSFRYMAPLVMEASCLRCHAGQGARIGDIRGGISVRLPAEDVLRQTRSNSVYLAASAVGIVVMMALIVYFTARYFIRDLNVAEQKLFNLATTDALTGVYNRREGFRLIEVETLRARRTQTPLCALMLDIDHFKKINDPYGHQAGDDVLKGMVAIIQKTLRGSDMICRYGGEEFLILATETNIENAKILAERLRGSLASQIIPAGPELVHVTVSIGLADYQPPETYEHMIFRADQALYQAKSNGRNRVCVG